MSAQKTGIGAEPGAAEKTAPCRKTLAVFSRGPRSGPHFSEEEEERMERERAAMQEEAELALRTIRRTRAPYPGPRSGPLFSEEEEERMERERASIQAELEEALAAMDALDDLD